MFCEISPLVPSDHPPCDNKNDCVIGSSLNESRSRMEPLYCVEPFEKVFLAQALKILEQPTSEHPYIDRTERDLISGTLRAQEYTIWDWFFVCEPQVYHRDLGVQHFPPTSCFFMGLFLLALAVGPLLDLLGHVCVGLLPAYLGCIGFFLPRIGRQKKISNRTRDSYQFG
jgi:hypothetical protein